MKFARLIPSAIAVLGLVLPIHMTAQADVTTNGCSGADSCTMAELTNGGSITIGDKVFENWSMRAVNLFVVPSQIMVTAIDDGTLIPGPGLRFDMNGQYYWRNPPGGYEGDFSLNIEYEVATTDGEATIKGGSLELTEYEVFATEEWQLFFSAELLTYDSIGTNLMWLEVGLSNLLDSDTFDIQSRISIDSYLTLSVFGDPDVGVNIESFEHRFGQRYLGSKPIADAGDDVSLSQLGFFQLNGSDSFDPDGDAITYSWALVAPPGSSAVLDDPTSPTPGFTADLYGNYEATLRVKDITGSLSDPDSVVVGFENIMPVADAGPDQAVVQWDTVQLDGSGSSDANSDSLTYLWTFDVIPAGSVSVLSDPMGVMPTFIPDQSGNYSVSLVVNDGVVDSAPDTVGVLVITVENAAEEGVIDVSEAVNALAAADFKNRNMQNALTSKINAILTMIDDGDYQQAFEKLRDDILKKTDGCANNGSPDSDDWIIDCASQAEVYPSIVGSIELLKRLL